MLNADFTGLIPASHPAVGFEFHEPNNNLWAPRLGATYRLTEKTVLGGAGDLLQPEPDEHVHVPDEQSAARCRVHLLLGSGEPHAVLHQPVRRGRPSARRRTSFRPTGIRRRPRRTSGALTSSRSSSRIPPSTFSIGSRTKNLDRSFFVNTPRPGSGPIQARRPNPAFGNLRIIQNDQVADYDAFTVHLRRRMSQGCRRACTTPSPATTTWAPTRTRAAGRWMTSTSGVITPRRTGAFRTGSSPAISTRYPSSGTRSRRSFGTSWAAGRSAA